MGDATEPVLTGGTVFIGREADGEPFVGMANLGFRKFKRKHDYPWCLNFKIAYGSGGLPSGDLNPHLQRFEDSLLSLLRKHFTVLDAVHVSCRGQREYAWYVADADRAKLIDLFSRLVNTPVIPMPTEWVISRDEHWRQAARACPVGPVQVWLSVIRTLLRLPSPRTRKNVTITEIREFRMTESARVDAADQALLEHMRERGVRLDRATEIRLYSYFPDRDGVVRAQYELLDAGYIADVSLPLGAIAPDGEFQLLTTVHAEPRIETIASLRAFLTETAERHAGHFDGWEIAVSR